MMREAESHADEDKKRKEEIETRNQADQAAYAAEKLLRDAGDKLAASDKAPIESALEELKKAIEKNDVAEMKRGMEALNQAQHKAAEALYRVGERGRAPVRPRSAGRWRRGAVGPAARRATSSTQRWWRKRRDSNRGQRPAARVSKHELLRHPGTRAGRERRPRSSGRIAGSRGAITRASTRVTVRRRRCSGRSPRRTKRWSIPEGGRQYDAGSGGSQPERQVSATLEFTGFDFSARAHGSQAATFSSCSRKCCIPVPQRDQAKAENGRRHPHRADGGVRRRRSRRRAAGRRGAAGCL